VTVGVRESLLSRISDAELRLASCRERAGLGDREQMQSALVFAAVVITLGEVVQALEDTDEPGAF
jgi:hypothetical protein